MKILTVDDFNGLMADDLKALFRTKVVELTPDICVQIEPIPAMNIQKLIIPLYIKYADKLKKLGIPMSIEAIAGSTKHITAILELIVPDIPELIEVTAGLKADIVKRLTFGMQAQIILGVCEVNFESYIDFTKNLQGFLTSITAFLQAKTVEVQEVQKAQTGTASVTEKSSVNSQPQGIAGIQSVESLSAGAESFIAAVSKEKRKKA